MASQSSRQKNDLKSLHEPVDRLLKDGAVVTAPSAETRRAADHLSGLGLVRILEREYVVCADHRDSDFPPKNRNCRGRIVIEDKLDEQGYDYRCPDCDRPVFPLRQNKRRHHETLVLGLVEGVIRFIEEKLKASGKAFRQPSEGVWLIDVDDERVTVCLADCCPDSKYLTREWAAGHPTCYLAMTRKALDERFLDEEWISRTCLADLICGVVDLAKMVVDAAARPQPATLRNASLPVYTKGASPIVAEPIRPVVPGREFRVECDKRTVSVERHQVVAPQGTKQRLVFQVLWEQFLEDLSSAKPAESFQLLTIEQIFEAVQKRKNERLSDINTHARRPLNRLQGDIETTVKKETGLPIGREDIIQTCKWKGAEGGDHGYRINPLTVLPRPFRPATG